MHQDVKNDEVRHEKTVGDRDEPSPRHARDDGGEESIREQHRHQRAGVHPRQSFDAARGSDVVANRADDVITAKDDEVENESE